MKKYFWLSFIAILFILAIVVFCISFGACIAMYLSLIKPHYVCICICIISGAASVLLHQIFKELKDERSKSNESNN